MQQKSGSVQILDVRPPTPAGQSDAQVPSPSSGKGSILHRPTKLPVQLQHCSSLGPGGRLKNAKKRQVWPTASNVRKFKIAKFWDPAVCANISPNCEDVGVFSLNQELVVEDWALSLGLAGTNHGLGSFNVLQPGQKHSGIPKSGQRP